MRRGFHYVRGPAPAYELQSNAGRRMPSLYRTQPFSPRFAADLRAGNALEREIDREGIVELSSVVDHLTAENKPPQLVQAGYPGLITGAGVANKILLIPKNPHRQSLKISNPTPNGNITYSFDAPLSVGGIGLGIPVSAGDFDEEANGSVSINAIYAWCDQATATFPIPVIGYEGVLSVVGNQR